MKLVRMLAAVAGLCLGLAATAQAQSPQALLGKGPVKIIVTFGAGSGGDALARLLGQRLEERIKLPVIVENKQGAGGNIGSEFVARSKPDGTTLLLVTPGPLATNEFLYRKLGYDPVKDFALVALIGTYPNILVAGAQSGIKSLDDIRKKSAAIDGGLAYASSGVGTTQHLAGELLSREAGIALMHVPYKATTSYVSDLVGGQLPLAFVAQAGVELIKDGRLVAIGVTSRERSETLPNVPTLEEQGIKGFAADSWYGIAAPAGTPASMVNFLNQHINAVLRDEGFRDSVRRQLITVRPLTPQAFGSFVASERTKWSKVIQAAKITLD